MSIPTLNTVLIGVAVLTGILIIGALTGRKSVYSEIFIPAAPSDVWQVLSNTSGYKDWNPVLVPIEGELVKRSTVIYQYTQEPGKTYELSAKVKSIHEDEHINQYGGTIGVLTFDHHYILKSVENGTLVTIHEDYRGIGVHFWDPSPVQAAYDRLGAALKEQVLARSKSGN
ncbi:MAG: SRPBCC domain-containing protein [Candidatus Thiodiazotropha lotti]|nr:SRPBCC domain-containing protein [Candidatus Thiodiazotropha lotti]